MHTQSVVMVSNQTVSAPSATNVLTRFSHLVSACILTTATPSLAHEPTWVFPNPQRTALIFQTQFPIVGPQAVLEERFLKLLGIWKSETLESSSISEKINHPAYKEIASLGTGAIPLVLNELSRSPDFWFSALASLASPENPVPKDVRRFSEVAEAWLKWGKERGYINGRTV